MIQRFPQRTIESIFPTPGTVSPSVALQMPFGPSKTAVPPSTSRTVHPLMVVGFVSGTGADLVKRFVRSTAGGDGVLATCFLSDESAVGALPWDVSWTLLDVLTLEGNSCTGLAAMAAVEDVIRSTDGKSALKAKKSEFSPPTHPRQRAKANKTVAASVVTARAGTLRVGATATRSRASILSSRSLANAVALASGI